MTEPAKVFEDRIYPGNCRVKWVDGLPRNGLEKNSAMMWVASPRAGPSSLGLSRARSHI
jgi:hypothetical protein